MSCLGVHFALSSEQVETLQSITTDAERREYLAEYIEEALLGTECAYETDKAWDAIHRVLTSGRHMPHLDIASLSLVILGGKSLYEAPDYIMRLVEPSQVREIAEALPRVRREDVVKAYSSIHDEDYQVSKSAEDLDYTLEYFEGLLPFFKHAAESGLYVLFSADQ